MRRRFHSGWRNLETLYRDLVDEWVLYDNSGEQPLVLAEENLKTTRKPRAPGHASAEVALRRASETTGSVADGKIVQEKVGKGKSE